MIHYYRQIINGKCHSNYSYVIIPFQYNIMVVPETIFMNVKIKCYMTMHTFVIESLYFIMSVSII